MRMPIEKSQYTRTTKTGKVVQVNDKRTKKEKTPKIGQKFKMDGEHGATYNGKVLDIKGNKVKVKFSDYDMQPKAFWVSVSEFNESGVY